MDPASPFARLTSEFEGSARGGVPRGRERDDAAFTEVPRGVNATGSAIEEC